MTGQEPYPAAQAILDEMFGEPVVRLFGPPYGIGAPQPARCHNGTAPHRGSARTDWEGQVIVMSADRAHDFRTRIQASNVGAETLAQLVDDLRRLVVAYEHQPLPSVLGDLVDTQDRAFTLLEGHQHPEQTRDLYLAAGIACGLMALIAYRSGRLEDSVRYAQSGADTAARSHGTAGVWLASNEARALAALHRPENAHAPVLELPAAQHIHGIATSVEHVRTALSALTNPGRDATGLASTIDGWSAERVTLPE